jgi:hypothetical protein
MISEVRELDANEQRQLRTFIDSLRQTTTQSSKGDELAELLFREGAVRHIPSSAERAVARTDRRRVPVLGKPVSETIIEERR